MSYKSHSLNVWSVEDGSSKLDIDAHNDRIDFITTASQPIKIHSALYLTHSGGDISDVSQNIKDVEADIATNNTTAADATSLVQSNLDGYISSNNSSVGTLQSGLSTEIAQRLQGQVDDATARASDKSDLQTLITANLNSLTSETSRATNAENALSLSISSQNTALTSAINTQKVRIDNLVANASLDLDTLKEISDAYSNVDSNTLNQISDMSLTINKLVQRVNALTSNADADFVVALSTAISELDLVSNKAFLTQSFSINYDMRDMWSSTTSAMLGWATYKAVVIAGSSGSLTGSSTDSEVEAYLKSALDAAFGSAVLEGSTLADYRLKYSDYSHYLLETGLTNGKPYYKGVEQSSLASCIWRLSYCSTAGDESTIYSTILSGSKSGKTLTISPSSDNYGIEFPVNGVGSARDGYKTTYTQLSLK